ncbi:MAG: hypothetical protein M9938_06595 [Solirubrobacterales bacterium]|nr:hypothetical protein [Solirubrobacterales bacterium]
MRGRTLPGPLLLPAGFAVLTVVGGLITCFSGLAPLTTPVSTVLAVAGGIAAFTIGPRKSGREDGSRGLSRTGIAAAAVAFLVLLVYGAPVLASGEPGFAGYIKLDDTSTWLAFTDHVLAHGHSVAGLAPSSYEATVQINLSAGYPVGAFIPLAVGGQLAGVDPAWAFQPYLALMAALMALVFFELCRPALPNVWWRAGAALVATQAPLLVGYAWWGGIKEVATALLAALLAAGLALLLPDRSGPGEGNDPAPEPAGLLLRRVVPLPAVAGAALIGVMGVGGAPWILGLLAGGAVLAGFTFRGLPPTRYLVAGLILAIGILVLGLPTVFASGQLFSPSQGPLTSGEEMGNLVAPLKLAQYAGPWPVGDFRLTPGSGLLTAVLVAATLVAAGFGILGAIRSRAGGLLLAAGGTAAGSLVVWLVGSPWIQGKALATGTASFLLLATVGIAALLGGGFPNGRLRAAGAVLLIVPVGVLASNALAYSHSWLSPHAQMAELERIGRQFAGQGPALMTEYQPYGVRHFLRELDAEGASELRRRQIPRLGGGLAEKGEWSDTDQLALDPGDEGVFTYRTLVLRRNPDQSRPPSPYRLVWRGRYYEVWQRPVDFDPASIVAHQPLGEGHQPSAIPDCDQVRALAGQAGPGGEVVAVGRRPNATAELTEYPPGWVPDPAAGTLTPLSDGTATGTVVVPAAGRYRVWLGGSVRGRAEVRIGGVSAGSVRGVLNNNGQYMELEELDLAAGPAAVTVTYERAGALRPATRDYPFGFGPVVIQPVGEPQLIRLPADRAEQLCGKRLDWIEAVRTP